MSFSFLKAERVGCLMSTSTLIDDKNKIQHRDRLLQLYGVDLAAAASSSALVAPFISVVDRYS